MFDKQLYTIPKSADENEKNNEEQLNNRRSEFVKLFENDRPKTLGPLTSVVTMLETPSDPLSPLIARFDFGGLKIKLILRINGDIFAADKQGALVSLEHANVLPTSTLIKFRNDLDKRFPIVEKEYDARALELFEERAMRCKKVIKHLKESVFHASAISAFNQRFENPLDAKSAIIASLIFTSGDMVTLKAPLDKGMVVVKNEKTDVERTYHDIDLV